MTIVYFQGWLLLQAMMAIAAWRFLGGWVGAFSVLTGSLIYLLWSNT